MASRPSSREPCGISPGRFEHRLFLSATPHNGHSNSFSTLLELLDPYRFTRGVKVRGKKALDVRGATSGIPAAPGLYPSLGSTFTVPARGFGFDVGAHVYPLSVVQQDPVAGL
jgi:hypothetical protein